MRKRAERRPTGYETGPVTKPPRWHGLVVWDVLFNEKARVAAARDAVNQWNATARTNADYYNAQLPQIKVSSLIGNPSVGCRVVVPTDHEVPRHMGQQGSGSFARSARMARSISSRLSPIARL